MQKRIYVPEQHLFDENTEEFIHFKGGELVLVHSLVSIAKWEFKYHVPFLSSNKTVDQVIDYIRCMTVNQNVNPMLYLCLTEDNLREINEYINDPATATTFSDYSPEKKGGKKEILTNELIYYYMFILEIPKECEKWHINLPQCNKLQLMAMGVPSERIGMSDICTYKSHDTFFSARRLGINSGRIFTAILMK